jgi:hypothetical protein
VEDSTPKDRKTKDIQKCCKVEPPSPTNPKKDEETIMQETSYIEGSQEEMEEEEEP